MFDLSKQTVMTQGLCSESMFTLDDVSICFNCVCTFMRFVSIYLSIYTYLKVTVRWWGWVVLSAPPPCFSPTPSASPVLHLLDRCGWALPCLKLTCI